MKIERHNNKTYNLTTNSGKFLASVESSKVNLEAGTVEIFPGYFIHESVDMEIYQELYKTQDQEEIYITENEITPISDKNLVNFFHENNYVHPGLQYILPSDNKSGEFIRGLTASTNLRDTSIVAVYPGVLRGIDIDCAVTCRYILEDKKNIIDGQSTQKQANLINHFDCPTAKYRLTENTFSEKILYKTKDPKINVQFKEKIIRMPDTNIYLPIVYGECIKDIPIGMPIITDYGNTYGFENDEKGIIDLDQKYLADCVLKDFKQQSSSILKIISNYYQTFNDELNPKDAQLSLPLLVAHIISEIGQNKNKGNAKLVKSLVIELIGICNKENYNDPHISDQTSQQI